MAANVAFAPSICCAVMSPLCRAVLHFSELGNAQAEMDRPRLYWSGAFFPQRTTGQIGNATMQERS